ncbi:unnamed protein product [Ascophyllum nodosum]
MARFLVRFLVLPMTVCGWCSNLYLESFRCAIGGRVRRRRISWTPPLHTLDTKQTGGRGDQSRLSTALGDDIGWKDAFGKDWADDGRDGLPFEVYDATPPPKKIGVAKLPPLTSSGDTLWHGAKHYKVLRVSSHYKYEGGRFVMRKKSIEAKELNRMAREQVAKRLVYGEGGKKGPRSQSPKA